jgi:predicted esterase
VYGRRELSLLFMHGLGDSGESSPPRSSPADAADDAFSDRTGTNWAAMLQRQLAPALPSLQIIAPHAPVGSLTVARGQRMPMWFDILVEGSRERPDMQDRDGMEQTRLMVESIIKCETEQGRKCVLAGFSQGRSCWTTRPLQRNRPDPVCDTLQAPS